MPLIQESYDSLPYIDSEPTASQRAQAQSLIDAELSADIDDPTSHPLLPPPPPSTLTPLLTSEYTRITSKVPISGIDLSRYEALDPPATTPHSDKNSPSTLSAWSNALSTSYTAHEYLTHRNTQLNTLQTSGKETWLAGNEALVSILQDLEKELAGTKEAIDHVVVERERSQREIEGELRVLEQSWRVGVGKTLEAELAAEGLRREILEARRAGAV